VSLAVQSDFEKLVVFGIAAFADWVHGWHVFGYASKQPQELQAIGDSDVVVELAAAQNVGQFVHGGFGHQQESGIDGLASRVSWNR